MIRPKSHFFHYDKYTNVEFNQGIIKPRPFTVSKQKVLMRKAIELANDRAIYTSPEFIVQDFRTIYDLIMEINQEKNGKIIENLAKYPMAIATYDYINLWRYLEEKFTTMDEIKSTYFWTILLKATSQLIYKIDPNDPNANQLYDKSNLRFMTVDEFIFLLSRRYGLNIVLDNIPNMNTILSIYNKLITFNEPSKSILRQLYFINFNNNYEYGYVARHPEPLVPYIIVFNEIQNQPELLQQFTIKIGMIIPPIIENKVKYIADNLFEYRLILDRDPSKMKPINLNIPTSIYIIDKYTDREIFNITKIYVLYTSREDLLYRIYGISHSYERMFFVKLDQSYNPFIFSFGNYKHNVDLSIEELMDIIQVYRDTQISVKIGDKYIHLETHIKQLKILAYVFKNKDPKLMQMYDILE